MTTATLNGAALDRFPRNNDLNSIKVALRQEHAPISSA